MSNPILWLALCTLAGFLAFLMSDTTMAVTVVAVLTGAFSLNAIHIAIDVGADPTSHNLFRSSWPQRFSLLRPARPSELAWGGSPNN